LQRKLTKIKTDNISGSFYLSSIYIIAKNFKKTAIKTEKNEKKLKKSDFSVIVKKKVISPSLRGAKRRSNPEKKRACTGLLRYARNESYALRTYQVLLCKTCGNDREN